MLVKSLQLHHKDFSSVQRAVQTKSLSQCVEFYYLWKKKLNLNVRTPPGLTVTLPNTNVLLPGKQGGWGGETEPQQNGEKREGSEGEKKEKEEVAAPPNIGRRKPAGACLMAGLQNMALHLLHALSAMSTVVDGAAIAAANCRHDTHRPDPQRNAAVERGRANQSQPGKSL
ncbi:zinc finger protein 541-like protein [Lates japonicus]|uniref:Zinc finger protein 541-like protein n=1 Tax=Lates japonicus TaxID=270547 RepID=A0AAD3N9I5_LATJO|nr:zinc finger protein 541-like protein [Lates japonicus]